MSNVTLALVFLIVFVMAGVLIWVTPDYDSLPKSDTEDDGPWPDGL